LNARDSISRNGVSTVDLREADVGALTTDPADVVMANLTAAALQRTAHALMRITAPGGMLIVSGFSPDHTRDVAGAFGRPATRELHDGEWAAALL
jgi:ribosomal protein L11 methylase PrmA